ncbi:sulfatase-like hydrolase/transferase [Anoxybacterium hadale]|uniref:Sulfatase-like hydrolase/transferase n=1 Tax=Anoxybacterium hadale TaxID=3408580 RepID=A0ACD1A9Q9_9FIRM|nr:sulfatase-like hydrolase/transferase [Clostridiales bacterium]
MFEQSMKTILIRIYDKMKTAAYEKSTDYHAAYGVVGIAAAAAVLLKLLLFYQLIGVTANVFFVWLISAFFTYVLFTSFRNKWIPTVVFLLLTILMFCDVTYSSFFNRYLSVAMLGAAGVLGDITESIKEVIKPWFFLLFTDVVLILVTLSSKRSRDRKNANDKEHEADEALVTSDSGSDEGFEKWLAEEIETSNSIACEVNDESSNSNESSEICNNVHGEDCDQKPEEGSDDIAAEIGNEELSGKERALPQRVKNAKKDKQQRIRLWLASHKKQVTAILMILLLIFNVTGSGFITSVSNQEFYSFHLKDIVRAITGGGDPNFEYAVSNSYDKEKNGPLFGVAKGRNLIVIQIESLQNLVINKTYNGQEITPNLNQIIKENTIYFDNYYQQIGSGNTSDAEFATNNSIYGTLSSYTYKLYAKNYFKGLPKLLKEQGYETAVYHAYEDRDFWNREDAYYSIGFDTYYGGIGGTENGQFDMTEWMGWGLTDSEFYKQVMPYVKNMTQPFYSFIISLSNHHPFQMLDHYKFIDLLPKDEGTIFGNYLNSAAYTDYALGQLMQELKDEGIYDNSIIAFYGDHLGLPKSDEEIFKSVSDFIGKDYDFDTMMNIPLIITIPGAEQNVNQTVSVAGGQMDFLPTIAYLMGFDALDTVYLGHNLLTIDSGFVAEQTYMTKGSFFEDDIVYEMSRDGVFENGRAWNKKTGESIPVKDCYEGYLKSMSIINTSEYILKNDVLRKIYLEEQDAVSAFSTGAVTEYPDEIVVAGAPDKTLMGTNSLEALNASYDAGYRNLKVEICWTEDKEAVMLSSWKELGKYFTTGVDSEITLEAFQNLNMRNGLTSMDYLDLIAWLKERPDAVLVAQAERSSDWFMKSMNSYAGSIMDQFISEVPGMVEYTGLYHSILNIDIGGNTVEQILEFIKLNNVPAIVMSKESAEGSYKSVKNSGSTIYIRDDETGIIRKTY